jgi:hypothetical protein
LVRQWISCISETVIMFHELLANAGRLEPGPLQTAARQQFPSIVKKSHLERRVVGDPVPCDGKYIIIGIASYSPHDLRLLDEIDAAYALWKDVAKVSVFDLMECRDMNDVGRFLLNAVDVRQTPVVELWDDGQLVTFQTGLPMTHKVLRNAGFLK